VLFGLAIDPRDIPPVLLVATALALVTAASKAATVWWGAARAGIGPRGRRRAAAVLIARGEFSIVIAEIGVAAGIVSWCALTVASTGEHVPRRAAWRNVRVRQCRRRP